MNINPRYVAYCTAHGSDPDAMLEADRERWPGGIMTGFVLWMSARWQAWRRLNSRGRFDAISAEDQKAFDVWLGENEAEHREMVLRGQAAEVEVEP